MPFNYNSYLSATTPWFYAGMVLVFFSLIAFEYQKKKWLALLLLVAGNLLMSGTYSIMQPFLHLWDEQVHALVAKNMMAHPFKPMLIVNPILDYDYKIWVGNHIWLHKQPWFLWQIALFFKLFGVSEFTLRLPSMLMFSGLILMVYRMGTIIKSKATGFYAALLLAGSNFLLQLVTGAKATDHNDVAFLFYVTASFWAWFEFQRSQKRVWLLFIGLFSGIAILNKWLPGLLVYSGWFFTILFSGKHRKQWKSYLEMAQSFLITVLVAAPWQIYILWRFPLESRFEYHLNSVHFFHPVEKHSGDWLFHFNHLSTLYGNYFKYLILFGLMALLLAKIKKAFKVAILTSIIVVYAFFTLATTKMIAFPFIVAPFIYIVAVVGLKYLTKLLNTKRLRFANQLKQKMQPVATIIILFFLFFSFLNTDELLLKTEKSPRTLFAQKINHTLIYKALPKLLGAGNYEFFNCRNFDHIKVMFYTTYNAHGLLPSKANVSTLEKRNISPVVFDNGHLPGWIMHDRKIVKIKSSIGFKGYMREPEIYR